MTVERLLSEISSRELAEWQAFYGLDPWGETRADLRSAIVASTVANANRDRKSKPTPFTAADFMPEFERPRPKGQDLGMKIHSALSRLQATRKP